MPNCVICNHDISPQGWGKHSASCDGSGPRRVRPKGPGRGNWGKGGRLSETHKEKISEAMKAHPNGGGYRKGAGIGKGCWHDSPIAGRVWLDSTYELRVARCLDERGIPWERNWDKFPYEWMGETCNYVPDFKIPEGYIEVKGFVRGKDKNKWRDFPHALFVLFEDDIIELESGGVPKWS